MSTGEEPRAGTTASVDRRVERVEAKVDGLETRLIGVERDLLHMREVQGLQMQSVVRGQDQLTAKVDGLISMWTEAQRQGAQMLGDPSATPAGRQIVAELSEVRGLATDAKAGNAALEKRMAYLMGGLAVIVFVINLVAPVVQAWLGLPH